MPKILPPFMAMILLGAGYALHFLLLPEAWLPAAARWAGVLPAVGGVVLVKAARARFEARGNPVIPGQLSVALITDGPYRFTRNPMYAGITLFLLGIALGVGTWPMLLAPAGFPLYVGTAYIPMEEKLLIGTFGDDYRAYMRRVRRWL
jgi:protein-S-isoprenylcysteine O-methyltransferase Ste14